MAACKTILVTGAGGQLGKEFQALTASFPEYRFLFATRNELPVEDFAAVNNYFKQYDIHYCINCAAYTAVDKAETEKEQAFLINAAAAGNLATVCNMHNTALIHLSTDYVFDGSGTVPYKETDTVNPASVYGQSKLKGEQLVLHNNPAAFIIRTSWVYSVFGNNFVKTMMRLMKEKESINVVNDQFGCPTYAADLAAAVMQIIGKTPAVVLQPAIFNYCNEGMISWYDFAIAIKEITGSACLVNPVPSSQYPTPAKRPHYSVLDTGKIKQAFQMVIPGWKESLRKCIAKMS